MSKVLLVTDAAWVTNEVKAALSLGPWNIEEVDDPRLVTGVATDLKPDVVIVDMQVGSMGGMAVIRGIRGEIDEVDRPRTVLLLDRSADSFIARRAGADSHVLKPINASELREAIGKQNVGSEEAKEEPRGRERKQAPERRS